MATAELRAWAASILLDNVELRSAVNSREERSTGKVENKTFSSLQDYQHHFLSLLIEECTAVIAQNMRDTGFRGTERQRPQKTRIISAEDVDVPADMEPYTSRASPYTNVSSPLDVQHMPGPEGPALPANAPLSSCCPLVRVYVEYGERDDLSTRECKAAPLSIDVRHESDAAISGERKFVMLSKQDGRPPLLGMQIACTKLWDNAVTPARRRVIVRILASKRKWEAFILRAGSKRKRPTTDSSTAGPARQRVRLTEQEEEIEAATCVDDFITTYMGADDIDSLTDVGDVITLQPLCPAITILREMSAVLGVQRIHPLLRQQLYGMGTSDKDAALHSTLPGDADDNKLFGVYRADAMQTFFPGGNFSRHLRHKFNRSQRHAIQDSIMQRGFTLIQGPPGTGKTATILGILNALHLTVYGMYYELLIGTRRASRCLATATPVEHQPIGEMPSVVLDLCTSSGTATPLPTAVTVDAIEPTVPPVVAAETVVPVQKDIRGSDLPRRPGTQVHTPAPLRGALPEGEPTNESVSVASMMRGALATAAAAGAMWTPPLPHTPLFQSVGSLFDSGPDTALRAVSLQRIRPRILVTAPSNAAVDGIVERMLKARFVDAAESASQTAEPATYLPNIMRVGDAASDAVKSSGVHLDSAVAKYMALTLSDCQGLTARLQHDLQELMGALQQLRSEWLLLHAVKAEAFSSPPDAQSSFFLRHGVALTRLISKFSLIQAKLCRVAAAMAHAEDPESVARKSRAHSVISASLLEEAEIILSTTSSSSLSVLETFVAETGLRFDAILVDEAAQAVEPATLIPLLYGCAKCILVGDPMQLPATVISKSAMSRGYDKSLLGRLMDAGMPYQLLDEQYRCHPLISAFPSQHFYGGKLLDAASVKGRGRWNPMHGQFCFSPLVHYDIRTSRHMNPASMESDICGVSTAAIRKSLAPSSWSNTAEVVFIVNLVRALGTWRGTDSAGRRVRFTGSVGIITFYRNQLTLLKHVLRTLFSFRGEIEDVGGIKTALGFTVDVHTVDGFQGQERDCIILSCVRSTLRPTVAVLDVATTNAAAKSSGVEEALGFVADKRRLNVALTRAKFACWIVGNGATLATSPDWSALIDFCDSRQCRVLLEDANVDVLSLKPPSPDTSAA